MKAAAPTAIAVLAICTSCAYTTVSSLPAHIKTVRAEAFENRTGYPGLEGRLSAALVRAFQADGTLVPVSRNADAVLRGAVKSVIRRGLQEDALDDVVAGRVPVVAVIALTDVSTGKLLLERTTVTSAATRPDEGLYRLSRGETESGARSDAVAELARNIVRRVVEVW